MLDKILALIAGIAIGTGVGIAVVMWAIVKFQVVLSGSEQLNEIIREAVKKESK